MNKPVTFDDSQPKARRRRLRGSCDACRKKKIKCDSAEMSENICTSCKVANIECTHDLPRQLTKLERQQNEIQDLQEKITRLESFIKRANPGEDIERLVNLPSSDVSPALSNHIPSSSSMFTSNLYPSPPAVFADTASSGSSPPDGCESEMSDEEDLAHVALAEHLGHLSIEAIDDRFFGQASAFMFLKHATTVKGEVTGDTTSIPDPRKYRRPVYWDMRPWELSFTTAAETAYVFPDKDLLDVLVSLYFDRSNCVLPVLHRPTFMKSLTMGQHHWDPSFGMIVLLVCAIGSKYSDDPRVDVPNDISGLSAGWQYFCQIPIHRKTMLYRSSLYDLQYYALAPLYLIGTSIPHAGWNILGIGLRYALERGAHRRKGPNQRPTIQDELQKRAFWAIVCFDHTFSSFVGRPAGFPSEAYDVEYPIECDDEYWEHEDPEQAFKQPAGKPCSITGFVNFIKLCEILGFALRTLYTNKKSRLLSGLTGTEWEARMVAELDSSLNQWKDALPDFLQWDPNKPTSIFFHQSASLHATYYYIRIQIHRPFLTKKTELSFASIAMCRNASRACAHVVETAAMKGHPAIPITITSAFTAGVNIAITLWSYQRSGHGDDDKAKQDLQRCLNALKIYERRWHCAGRLADMLTELSAMKECPPPTHKRRRVSVEAELPPSKVSRMSGSVAKSNNFEPYPYVVSNDSESFDMDTVNVPANEWDLRKLFFTELNYLQGNLNSMQGIGNMFGGVNVNVNVDYQANQGDPVQFQQAGYAGGGAPLVMGGLGGDGFGLGAAAVGAGTAGLELDGVTSQELDLANLWSDVPTAFGCYEDWDAYLASVGQSS